MDAQVEKLKQKHPSIGDFRNTGLLGCIELVKNRKTKEPMAPWNAAPTEMEIMNKIAAKIAELGMFTFVRWNYIFTCPPLCITKDEMDEGLEAEEIKRRCPRCGKLARTRKGKEAEDLEIREVVGRRGEVEYGREGCYCGHCRIFFSLWTGEWRSGRKVTVPRFWRRSNMRERMR